MKNRFLKLVSVFAVTSLFSSCVAEQPETTANNAFPAMKTEESIVETTAIPEEITTFMTSEKEMTTAVSETDNTISVINTTVTTENTTTTTVTTEITTTTEPVPVFIESDTDRFSEKLSEIYEDYGIIGMSVAVFSDGEVIYTENLGYADTENKVLCTDNTRYRIASPSKLVSTIAIMKLCEEGKLSLDTVLSEATGIDYNWKYCNEDVKLWHLLTHTSGLFDSWSFEFEPNMKYDINRLMRISKSGNEPGTVYNYSNFGSGSMGAIVERITGEYFHNYADRVLFTPLGMDAGYVIDHIENKESCANLYDFDGEILKVKEWGRKAEYYESFGLGNSYYTAQCELIITASDLAKIGIALSGDGTFEGKRVISKESVNAINKSYFSAENFDMGLNVRIYDDFVDGRIIYGHPGNALGCITGLYYDPSDGTGIVLLTNHCLPTTEENGIYSALYDAVTEAYYCFFRYEE